MVYTDADVLSIDLNKDSGIVSYLKNGEVFYVSNHIADLNSEYSFIGAPLKKGIGISHLQFGSKDAVAIYENVGVNQKIATIGVNDADSRTWTYSLVNGDGDTDNAAVIIGGVNNNEIILAANPIKATQTNYSIRIKVTDEYANTYEQAVYFSITDNLAPSDLLVKDNLDILTSPITTPEIAGEISEVDLTTSGTILHSGSANWGTTIISANTVLASKGVVVQFQPQGTGNAGMWGLNIAGETGTARSFEVIDYAIYLNNGSILIYENGSGAGVSESYALTDTLSIQLNKDTGLVSYLKNDTVFHTSTQIADLNAEYNFTGAPFTRGIGIANLLFGNQAVVSVYENAGANQTIAKLDVNDTDSNSWTYTLVSGDGDDDNAAVAIGGINNNEIILLADPSFAVKAHYSVRVSVSDDHQNSRIEVIEFNVIENATPIAIQAINASGDNAVIFQIPTIKGDISDVDLTSAGTILKSAASDTWTTTVSSNNTVLGSSGVKVTFQAEGSGNGGMWGINTAEQAYTSRSYDVIDYAIYFSGSSVSVYENGISKGGSTPYSTSDVFSIEMDKITGQVTYLKNDFIFFTSSVTADINTTYTFTGAPFTVGAGISNLTFSNQDTLTLYENKGENKAVAILNVDDPDSTAWTYTLVAGDGDTDNAAVVIAGTNSNELILIANPDLANQQSYSVRIRVTDNHHKSYEEVIQFNVIEATAPTDIITATSLFIPEIIGEISEVNISIAGDIVKTAALGWSTTVSSANSVLASKGVQVEFSSIGTGNAGMWGLNVSGQSAAARSYDVIDYAVYLLNGSIRIFENSIDKGAFASYFATDILAVNIDKHTGIVTYLKNGSVFYTSSNLADLNAEYTFTGTPYSQGIGIGSLKFGSLEPTIFEDEGSHQTVVFLDIEDEDSSTWTYSLATGGGDYDNNAVIIGGNNNNEIILLANPKIANQENYSIRVKVSNNHQKSYEEVITFVVIKNSAPIDIIVNNSAQRGQHLLPIPAIIGETDEVDLSSPGAILKTTSLGWDTTVKSENAVMANKGVQVSFSAQGSGNAGMWGLNISEQAATARSYDVIDYAIYLLEGTLYIFENSVNKGAFLTYSAADTFTVNLDKDSGSVTYMKNDSVFYTSTNLADLNAQYLFTGTPYSPGIGISNLQFGSLEPIIYENEGTNKTVAVLDVDDEDSNTWTYLLVSGVGDDDNTAVFLGGINNNEIILINNPDISQQENYSVRVSVTDNHNNSYEEIIEFKVLENTPPIALSIKDAYIGEVDNIDVSTQGTLLKVDASDANALVMSKEQALASDGVSVAFKAITDSNVLNNGMFGLSTLLLKATDHVTHSYEVIDYAISLDNGVINVYEKGIFIATYGAFTVYDLFSININEVNGSVTYLKNGAIFYTSATNADLTDTFSFAAAPYNENTGITDITLSFDHLSVYENIGPQQSIATLITDDPDSQSWSYSLVSGTGDNDNSAISIGGINNNELIFIANPNSLVQDSFSIRVQVTDNQGASFEKVINFSVRSDPNAVQLLLKDANGQDVEPSFMALVFSGETNDVDISNEGVIIKTGPSGWNTIIETEQTTIASDGAYVEFKAAGTADAGVWGLNTPGENNTTSANIIDYGIHLSSTSAAYIYENTNVVFALGAYTASDVFAINIDKDTAEVTYLKNGSVVYRALNSANLNAEYAFVGAPFTTSQGITDFKFQQFKPLTIYENSGDNTTVANLTADDDNTTWHYSIVDGIGDDDNTALRIGGLNNDQLILIDNPNVPTQESYSVRIKMTNANNRSYEEIIEFSVVERTLSTPLILDLDNDGVETLPLSAGIIFDIDADGIQDKTGWASGDDGFLVRDINQDGLINDASELFGEHTIKSNGEKAEDGFAALREFDQNLDGIIDDKDDIYQELHIWQDINEDGISQANELFTLLDKGVSSIEVNPSQVMENSQGNITALRALWLDALDNKHTIDDVWLAYTQGQPNSIDLNSLIQAEQDDENHLDQYFNQFLSINDIQGNTHEANTDNTISIASADFQLMMHDNVTIGLLENHQMSIDN
ncbi:hypothetical protein WN093_03345 [Gammaproteobacteria bacterium AS21]